jgi:long-chain acyl-CoA synthetase
MSDLALVYSSAPQRMAFVGETALTFEEVQFKSGAIATALSTEGLRPGDSVAIATANRAGFYTCFAGCFASGFPVVVIDPAAGPQELRLMLHKAAPSALIADDDVLRSLTGSNGYPLPRIVWRVGPPLPKRTLSRWVSRGRKHSSTDWPSLDEIATTEAIPVSVSSREDLPAYIMFTSGTTSSPKAVVVSRGALRHHVDTLSRVFGYDENARLLTYLPIYHTDGLVHGVAASLLTGMTVVHPGPFSASTDIWQALRSNNISHFLAVPTILSIIRRTFGDRAQLFQYDGFRNVISTAGYLNAKFWQDFQEFFGVRVSNFYGMTETVSGSLYCGPDNDNYCFDTVGKPVDTEVRIVDEGGAILPPDKVGELQISGKHLMTGYLDDSVATKATIVDGWLSTGDLFFQNRDGFFHYVGRRKNIIKRGGITVYPEDIQRLLMDMPGVLKVEVIGLPDPMFEEIIVVCAVVEAGTGAEDLRAMCRHQLSPERQPDRIELMEHLPQGPAGKVLRAELVAILEERGKKPTSSHASLRTRVINLAAETFSTESAKLDETSSPDTVDGWDSFAGMEFVLALEREFDLRLSARDIMRLRNIGKALEIVSAGTNDGQIGI